MNRLPRRGKMIWVTRFLAPMPSHAMPEPANEIPAGDLSSGTVPPTDEERTIQDLPALGVVTAGRFQLLGEIARGGMGVVYSALDPQFGREIAVKTLTERLGDRRDAVRRFDEEARITGQLQHPNIPAVFESGLLEDGRPFLAMKLVKGRTLAELLEGSGPNRTDLIPAFEQVCQAVAYAHNRRVIHRDLKPANVMVGAFVEVQVMDWGLAKVLGERRESEPVDPEATTAGGTKIHDPRSATGGSETQAGSVLGTLAYMPPEQASGSIDLIDERADVFGLGAILCVILTGEPPYLGKGREAVRVLAVRAKLDECYARLQASGADPELVALARRCLSPEVTDRPRNAGEVAAAVAELRRNAEERARAAELNLVRAEGERARAELRSAEERKRRRVQLALAASVVGFLLLGGAGAWWAQQQAQQQAEERRREGLARDEQERRVREGVESALARLPDLHQRALWPQARATVEQAEQLLGEDGDTDLRARVAEAKGDTEFAKELDAIRMGKIESADGRNYDRVGALPKYANTFRKNGFDAATADGAALRKWLADSRVQTYALAALDDWATTEIDPARRKHLFALIAEATGQPWREKLAEVWDDGSLLEKVFAAIPPKDRSPSIIAAVAKRLNDLGLNGARRLEEGLQQYPADFWLHESIGHIGGRGQVQRQIGAYRAALAIRPQSVVVLNNLGVLLRGEKNLDGAVACYREAIRHDPTYYIAHSNLGNALLDMKDPEGAIASYRHAIHLEPKFAAAHSGLGSALCELKDLTGAVAACREAILLDPKLVSAHTNLGNALYAQKKLQEAADSYRKAIDLDPKFVIAHSNLGSVLRDQKDFVRAVASCREAIRLDPNYASAHNNLGNALFSMQLIPEAIAAYRKAILLDPKNASAHNNLGSALVEQNDSAGAVLSFREATRLDPNYVAAHFNLGTVLLGRKEFDEAIIAFREARRLDTKDPATHFSLGTALLQKKDLDPAIVAFQDAICLDRELVPAHHNLGIALFLKKDYAGAATSFEAVIRLDPMNVAAHFGLGSAHLQRGNFLESLRSFEKARKLNVKGEAGRAPNDNLRSHRPLEGRLAGVRQGTDSPHSPPEAVAFAELSGKGGTKGYALAYRLFLAAFADDAKLIEANCYNAACFAVRFAAGDDIGEKACGKQQLSLRKQAAEWLALHLASARKLAASDKSADRRQAADLLTHWIRDTNLVSVRDPERLAALAPEERQRWEAFWADVRAELAKATATGKPRGIRRP